MMTWVRACSSMCSRTSWQPALLPSVQWSSQQLHSWPSNQCSHYNKCNGNILIQLASFTLLYVIWIYSFVIHTFLALHTCTDMHTHVHKHSLAHSSTHTHPHARTPSFQTHLGNIVYSLDESCQTKLGVFEVLHCRKEVEVSQRLLHQLVLWGETHVQLWNLKEFYWN